MMASIAGRIPMTPCGVYSASKHGLVALAELLQIEDRAVQRSCPRGLSGTRRDRLLLARVVPDTRPSAGNGAHDPAGGRVAGVIDAVERRSVHDLRAAVLRHSGLACRRRCRSCSGRSGTASWRRAWNRVYRGVGHVEARVGCLPCRLLAVPPACSILSSTRTSGPLLPQGQACYYHLPALRADLSAPASDARAR